MRRLTLILSDLYLPEDMAHVADAELPDLPALEELLRIASPPVRVVDWRSWLRSRMRGQGGETPLTAHCANGIVPGDRLESTWFATPVNLEIRIDHVRLADHGLLRLEPPEREMACREFSRVFGAPYALHDGGERTFFLSGIAPVQTPTVDPARLLGSDVGAALPGREATELRRLGAEIEMWLHSAAFNASRERAGKPRVSTLWVWRGPTPAPHDPPREAGVTARFLGGDPLIGALARQADQVWRGVPTAFEKLDVVEQVVAEFAPLTGAPHEQLSALEANWFAPARAALTTGRLGEIELVANDRIFRIDSRARWRFWRRRSPWHLHLLGGPKA